MTIERFGRSFAFETDAGVFSRAELDEGSALLIDSAGPLRGRALDLGCGWGPVGILLAYKNPEVRFVLSDVNQRAVALAQNNIARAGLKNAEAVVSEGFEALIGDFDHVLCNPPIRAGKAVIYRLFDDAFERLRPGGGLTIVIRKRQGAPSAQKHLDEVFGNAEIVERSRGYWVIRSAKGEGT